ncbi:predicted protein [Nematostella vectensis]|uniref:Lethal giant larvae homologue 2 domain-containing protein n=1 Tax=Nematostella vectensis TaxID=45351 RepID=A7RKR7_NEMVE|nr:predicted protein [Nematostella vectensis]|eukprot:XP_001640099.1 predicted protein [Nematostella vectensis]
MFKFLHRGRGKTSEGRIKDKLGQDLFLFNKTIEHGFPHKPSALAQDPKLNLLAIGTEDGTLRIFGRPGVQLTACHDNQTRIQELHFLPEQGRVISVCDDGEQNSIHLWEVNKKDGKSVLEEVKTCTLEGRCEARICICCLSMKTNRLLLGTEGGNIYLLDINSFELQEYVIYQDVVMQSVQEDSKTNAGSVEAIQEHPNDSNKILIGYKKGLTVLWNHESCSVQQTFPNSIDLESLSWHHGGDKFISAHADGSLTEYTIVSDSETTGETSTPFGPFPCKAITKIEWHDNSVFFAGGMPRASYGDKNCISLVQGSTTQVVFDFTSRVIDFITVIPLTTVGFLAEPACLAVLCEQELVVIDLKTKEQGYPTFMKPYLTCLHSSPITTSYHCHGCPSQLWNQICAAGKDQIQSEYSHESWPITGGKTLVEDAETKDILITGHEDGSVQFWDVSQVEMQLMYTLSTSKMFISDHEGHDNGTQEVEEEGWPPFKKVGNFDPFSDDPRFAVQKILLSTENNMLTIAGNGGQILVYEINDQEKDIELQVTEIDLVEDKEKLQWKGHGPLAVKEGAVCTPRGFQPVQGVQFIPAAAISSLAVCPKWGALAAGTCHGFALLDTNTKKVVTTKCTVSSEELSATGEPISRKKSLKKSIRDSFRRLRRSRKGTRKGDTPRKEGEAGAATPPQSPAAAPQSPPVQRLVHESRVDETVLSMVRCIYFVETFVKDGVHHSPSMWVGTNAGHIYVYYITLPDEENKDHGLEAEVGKEIKLKHKAPIVAIFVVDKDGSPILADSENDKGVDMSGQHSLVICSEEQFKVFSLPHLKARQKEKLTAIDGSRIRKIGIINAHSKSDASSMVYHCLACLSNQGDLAVYTVPGLKLQLKVSCMKKEDMIAIQSLVFTSSGQGFYLRSPSEMQRFSLTASEL